MNDCRMWAGHGVKILEPLPSSICPNIDCLGDVFATHVKFDDNGAIAWYVTRFEGITKCVACGTFVTLPTEIDHG